MVPATCSKVAICIVQAWSVLVLVSLASGGCISGVVEEASTVRPRVRLVRLCVLLDECPGLPGSIICTYCIPLITLYRHAIPCSQTHKSGNKQIFVKQVGGFLRYVSI